MVIGSATLPRKSHPRNRIRNRPQRRRLLAVYRVGAETAEGRHAVLPDGGDIAVFSIDATLDGQLRRDRAPHAGGGALFDSLEHRIEIALRVIPAHRHLLLHGQIALQGRADAAGVEGELDVGGFGLTIGGPFLIWASLQILVVEIDPAAGVADRRERARARPRRSFSARARLARSSGNAPG